VVATTHAAMMPRPITMTRYQVGITSTHPDIRTMMYMTNRVSPAPLMAEAKMMFMVSKMEYSATNLSSTSVSRRISGKSASPDPAA